MKLNSKLSWGLAWAGLALVVAVPSADFLAGQPTTAVITSDTTPVTPAASIKTDPIKTASITAVSATPMAPLPVVTTTTPRTIDLAPAATPTVSTTPAIVETKVATVTPAPKAVPFPAPLSQRPHLPAPVAAEDAPLIIDESNLVEPVAEVDSDVLLPPADIPEDPLASDPAALRAYLIERGLIDDDESTASIDSDDTDYDPDGFYLSDGPNGEGRRLTRRERLDLLLDEEDSGWDFNLF